jgi:hypothetical protein
LLLFYFGTGQLKAVPGKMSVISDITCNCDLINLT